MIESQLTQYGIFGLWTLFNLFLIKYFISNQDKRENKLFEVIENNTAVINRFLERTK